MSKPTVAIFGVNGFLGKPISKALTSPEFSKNFKLPIIAITRDASKKTNTDTLLYREASTDNPASLEKALEGVNVLINLGPSSADAVPIIQAAAKEKVKLYIPSQFGSDAKKLHPYFPILDAKTKHSEKARDLGLKTVDILTSFFAEPGSFLYEIIGGVGYNKETNTVTYYGDKDAPFALTRLDDIGKAVAVIAAKDPATLPDEIRIFSDTVTQEQVIQQYEKAHNIKVKREYKDTQVALKEAQQMYKENGYRGKDFLEYLHVAVGIGEDAGVIFSKDDREFVNPNESIFKWTKY